MADQSALGLKSPELVDKIIFYFVDHGMQILTAIVIMGIGLLIARVPRSAISFNRTPVY